MRVLVTAGNTQVPIDRVRCITNIFSGRTGTQIAVHATERGHAVTLLTSQALVVSESDGGRAVALRKAQVQSYRTFQDLKTLMEAAVRGGGPDAIIHCAAVSDYEAAGIFAPAPGTAFHPETGRWSSDKPSGPELVNRAAGKVKSDEPELWLRLTRTIKLVDLIRRHWEFAGVLVKFKLEVDIGDARLLEIAERSRRHSAADLMVANTLDGMRDWAFIGPLNGHYERLPRADLPGRLLGAVEKLHEERGHG